MHKTEWLKEILLTDNKSKTVSKAKQKARAQSVLAAMPFAGAVKPTD